MSCDFEKQVQRYHDGELLLADVAAFESHLADCEPCTSELKSLRAMSNLIGRNLPVAELPAGLLDRLHDEVRIASDYSLLPLAPRSLVGLAAAVLIVASAGLFSFHPSETASAPQPWEGAPLSVSNDSSQLSNPSASANGVDPELIVADLSRTSGR